jgi:heme-degrading monooxygenase HmoA
MFDIGVHKMIGVLTHHWSKENLFDQAKILLSGNGQAQSHALGFVSRTTLHSRSHPRQITSLVLWESDDVYNQWKSSIARSEAMEGSDRLWESPPVSERFDIPKTAS